MFDEEEDIKPTVLYVDDEESNLRIFKTAFKRHYEVFTAVSGEEGLEILKENDIHIIITDQKMPKMTGIEFLEKVLPLYPDPIRMILTGFSDVEAIIRAINSGRVYRYITKPWNKDELKITIDKAVETYNLQRENKSLIVDLKQANEGLEQKVKERTQEIEKQNEKIQKQSLELSEKNRKITDSIRYAQRIQQAILPQIDQIKAALPNSFILFKPKDIVSGDFYWFFENEQKLFLAAVDCTGHGVPGAFMSLIGSNLLNALIKYQGLESPDQILARLHLSIKAELRQESNSNRDGMDMALCVIDKNEKYVEFAGAKSSLFYTFHENGQAQQVSIKGDMWSIGGVLKEDETRIFTKHCVIIDKTTHFYIFSDGYQDQFGGQQGRKFMRKNLENLLFGLIDHKPDEQLDALSTHFEQWKGNTEQIDDVMLIGFCLEP